VQGGGLVPNGGGESQETARVELPQPVLAVDLPQRAGELGPGRLPRPLRARAGELQPGQPQARAGELQPNQPPWARGSSALASRHGRGQAPPGARAEKRDEVEFERERIGMRGVL